MEVVQDKVGRTVVHLIHINRVDEWHQMVVVEELLFVGVKK
jgi:hypothetical protein